MRLLTANWNSQLPVPDLDDPSWTHATMVFLNSIIAPLPKKDAEQLFATIAGLDFIFLHLFGGLLCSYTYVYIYILYIPYFAEVT